MGKIFDIDYKTFSEIERDIVTFIFYLNFDNYYSGLNFCGVWEMAWERYERYDDIFTMNGEYGTYYEEFRRLYEHDPKGAETLKLAKDLYEGLQVYEDLLYVLDGFRKRDIKNKATIMYAYSRHLDLLLDIIRTARGTETNSPQEPETTPSPQEPEQLPGIDGSKTEQSVFKAAIKRGYMVQKGDGYEWKSDKKHLAYMLGRLYCGDKVVQCKHGQEYRKGMKRFPTDEAQELFGFNVSRNRSGIATNNPPTKFFIIDTLFEQ